MKKAIAIALSLGIAGVCSAASFRYAVVRGTPPATRDALRATCDMKSGERVNVDCLARVPFTLEAAESKELAATLLWADTPDLVFVNPLQFDLASGDLLHERHFVRPPRPPVPPGQEFVQINVAPDTTPPMMPGTLVTLYPTRANEAQPPIRQVRVFLVDGKTWVPVGPEIPPKTLGVLLPQDVAHTLPINEVFHIGVSRWAEDAQKGKGAP